MFLFTLKKLKMIDDKWPKHIKGHIKLNKKKLYGKHWINVPFFKNEKYERNEQQHSHIVIDKGIKNDKMGGIFDYIATEWIFRWGLFYFFLINFDFYFTVMVIFDIIFIIVLSIWGYGIKFLCLEYICWSIWI